MEKTLASLIFASSVLLFSPIGSATELELSGYGSIVAGKTFNNSETFTADWHDVGQYNNELSFTPESMFALQARGHLTPDLTFTAMVSAKGTDDFKPEFDWYYATYQLSDRATLMAGRRAIPMYYFSEFIEVGLAYPWMRPPANLYWWQIQYFNGIHASYDFPIVDLSSNVTLFYGNERDNDNKEIGALYNRGADRIAEYWENISGLTWSIAGDNFDLRFMHFSTTTERKYFYLSQQVGKRDRDINFYGLGGTLTVNQLSLFFDYNYVDSEIYGDFDRDVSNNSLIHKVVNQNDVFPTLLLTATYTIGDFVPFISYSKADHKQSSNDVDSGSLIARAVGQNEDDYEQHELYSLGLRFNYAPNVAMKVQYDIFNDQGFEPQGWAFHGDSTTLTVGVDFIF